MLASMQAIAVGDAVRSALTNASLVSPSSVDSSTDDEVPSTFDRSLSKMEQQIRKYKAKIQDHRRDVRLNDLAAEEKPTSESG